MKKIILILSIIFSMSSCIEIRQEITVNKDLSGSMTLVLDMGALTGNLLNAAEKFINIDFFKKIQTLPNKAVAKIQGMNGISNIKAIDDKGKGMFGLSFDFKDSKTLNQTFYKLFNQKKTIFKPSLLKIKKNQVKLTNITPYINLYYKLNKKDITNEELFKFITYKIVIKLPETLKKVAKNKENLIKQSDDKKILTFSFPVKEIIEKSLDTDIKVKF